MKWIKKLYNNYKMEQSNGRFYTSELNLGSFFTKRYNFDHIMLSIFLGLFLLLVYKLPVILIMNNSEVSKLFYIAICIYCSVVAFCLKKEILTGNKLAQYSMWDFFKVISVPLFFLTVVPFFTPYQFYYNLFSSVPVIFSLFIPEISVLCHNFWKVLWDFFTFIISKKNTTFLSDGQSADDHRLFGNRRVTIENFGRNSSTNPSSNPSTNPYSNQQGHRPLSPFSRRTYAPTASLTQVSDSIGNPSQIPRTLPPIRSILGDVLQTEGQSRPDYGRGLDDIPYTTPKVDRVPLTRVNDGVPQVFSYTHGWVNRYMGSSGTYVWSTSYNDYFPCIHNPNPGSGVIPKPGETQYRVSLHWDGGNYKFAMLKYSSVHTGSILSDGVPINTYNVVESLHRYCEPPH